jgi:uncharacterized secreted protein with C-terminal beta-propeller domain
MLCKSLIGLSFCFTLVGCGGSDDDSLPELNEISMALTPLSKNTSTTFEQHIKNGLYIRSSQDNNMLLEGISLPVADTRTSAEQYFSSTTLQTEGVDEGDRIKYDGEYLYIAKNHYGDVSILEDNQGTQDSDSHSSIRIMQRSNNGEISEVADVTLNKDTQNISSLYLQGSDLAVMSNINNYSTQSAQNSTFMIEPLIATEQLFNLTILDVAEPSNSSIKASYTIDGQVIDSRRVDNIIYVVSRYTPSVDGVVYATTLESKADNYKLINNTNISQLLPSFRNSDDVIQPLVSANDCYIPEDATNKDGFDSITTLTAIDMSTAKALHSVCINTDVSGIYASEKTVYLYGTDYQYSEGNSIETSIIHKFSLDNLAINYVASGTVDGRFNWDMSNLRFSEKDQYLRVVTTSGDRNSGYQHRVNVLEQVENKLSLVAQLPNKMNSKVIGKMNEQGIVDEDIKAVRFYGDTAFIVTFLTTDPLYVIDLSDNTNPIITGELEVPGYSAYLQPLSDNLLLGIGQNVDDDTVVNFANNINNTDKTDVSPVIEGAKVTLFDVSELNSPREITSIVFEDGFTPVEYDYHALTYLPMSDGSFRFALPVERWNIATITEGQQKIDVWSPDNFIALLEVSGSDSNATLVHRGSVSATDESDDRNRPFYTSGFDDRAVFHYNDIYYVHGNRVWQSNWCSLDDVGGPF